MPDIDGMMLRRGDYLIECMWRLLRAQLQEDFDMVMDIWDRYPDSVIELSKFARPVGALGRKVVIWEVRDF